MAFDVRAMEDIATAPASSAERTAGRWIGAVCVVFFAVMLPGGSLRLPAVAAFVPAVVGVAVLAESLTALLFYVQYRIARNSQLALLAIAYGASALLTIFYILTFPNVFSRTGLFGANLQTSAWTNNAEHVLFALFLIAFALNERFHVRLGRGAVRALAVAAVLLVVAIAVTTIVAPLPVILGADLHSSPLFRSFISPVVLGVYVAAVLLLAMSGTSTVAQVWLLVVAVLRFIETMTVSGLAGGRYTAYWYEGRALLLVSASVVLGVFLVKINDLLLRLAQRNRALTQRTEVAEIEIAEGELRYRTLANVVPQLIWSATADGTVDYVNDRWIAYTGLDLAETRAAGWRAALDESQPATLDDAWHRSLQSGEAFSGEYRLREAASGRMRWFLINALAIRDLGADVSRWIGSCTDIDRQKRIEEREAFLANAGDRLSVSLDLTATLATIADLVVGRMADWARVDLIDDDGRFVPMTIASSLPDERRALDSLIGRPVGNRLEEMFAIALARREPVVDREQYEFADGVPGVRRGTAIVIPLTSGDTFLGTLTLVRDDRREPDVDEVAVARDFGRRAAHALDHARLYERERSTADALQRAMLPQVMPQLPNVKFSASYSAASESQRVGGDFYDAFTLPDGRVALTIGDVTGHGLEAAVIMGEIRQALRAASFERAEPATILDRASSLLVASGRGVFVTAVFGVLDTQTGRFEYATAGHPAPLVYDGSRLVRLATSGLPIGLRDDEGVDFAVTLPPFCTLVLYTDGLLEFSHDLDDGERRIEAAIRELDGSDIDHLAGAIMKRVLLDDQPSDDIAILTATLAGVPHAPPFPSQEWRFRSTDARTATHVRHEVGELVAEWTGDAERRHASELVFGELFSNVVRHAPGEVSVALTATANGAVLRVRDTGPGCPTTVGMADVFAESGRGLHLVRALGDAVTIDPSAGGTRIEVDFHRPAAASSAGSNSFLSNA